MINTIYQIVLLVLDGWRRDDRDRWYRMGTRHVVRDPMGDGDVESPYWTLNEALAQCEREARIP